MRQRLFHRHGKSLGPRIVALPSGGDQGPAGNQPQPPECSFCHTPIAEVTGLVQGPGDITICANCLARGQEALDSPPDLPVRTGIVSELYRLHFRDPRRERQFLASISFFVTFATVRLIVRSIQRGRGPFHNVSAGGRHIHHLVWGILGLLLVGYSWLLQIGTGERPPRRWMRLTSVVYGAGSALTLDEFALWLNLSDVYFGPEGRESIDAVVLFGSVISIGFWGHPFIRSLARLVVRGGPKHTG